MHVPSCWFALGLPGDTPPAVGGDPVTFVGEHTRWRGRSIPTCVRAGMRFGWFGDGPPDVHLPPVSEPRWTPMQFFHEDFGTHPAHVMRDLVDLDHFHGIHGYADARYAPAPQFEGPTLSIGVDFGWDTGLPRPFATHPAHFDSEAVGLGFQLTDVAFGWGTYLTRHLVLPVPLGHDRTRVYCGVSVAVDGALARSPAAGAVRFFGKRLIGWAFRRDVARDAELWLALARHGAPPDSALFARYARWADQFHPSPAKEASVA